MLERSELVSDMILPPTPQHCMRSVDIHFTILAIKVFNVFQAISTIVDFWLHFTNVAIERFLTHIPFETFLTHAPLTQDTVLSSNMLLTPEHRTKVIAIWFAACFNMWKKEHYA